MHQGRLLIAILQGAAVSLAALLLVSTPATPAEVRAAARAKTKAKAASLKARHTVEHNLRVFPSRVADFVKNGFKNKA